MKHRETPDGRYLIVKGRLWRKSNPNLSEAVRQLLVHSLMTARRSIHKYRDDPHRLKFYRNCVHSAKLCLGERGEVWWTDGAPDENRKMAVNSSYSEWWEALNADAE